MSTPNPAYPITVYGLPDEQCFGCRKTKQRLTDAGIEFASVDLSHEDNEELRATFAEQGLKQAPYVVTPDKSWTGLIKNNIDDAITAYRAAVEVAAA